MAGRAENSLFVPGALVSGLAQGISPRFRQLRFALSFIGNVNSSLFLPQSALNKAKPHMVTIVKGIDGKVIRVGVERGLLQIWIVANATAKSNGWLVLVPFRTFEAGVPTGCCTGESWEGKARMLTVSREGDLCSVRVHTPSTSSGCSTTVSFMDLLHAVQQHVPGDQGCRSTPEPALPAHPNPPSMFVPTPPRTEPPKTGQPPVSLPQPHRGSHPVDSIVAEACQTLATRNDDFWIIGALGDWSYEEGCRNASFKRYLESWPLHVLPPGLEERLPIGINGNLAACFRQSPLLAPETVQQSQSRGSDIRFTMPDGTRVEIEVKHVFDGTIAKQYAVVAGDLAKLSARSDKDTIAYAVVFFTQLPHYHYPAGCWYSEAKRYPARQCVERGIQRQIAHLCLHTKEPPTWPESGMFKHSLSLASTDILPETISGRYKAIFCPSVQWQFHAGHLKDAAVGCAIWRR
jgi:hypothetical protein